MYYPKTYILNQLEFLVKYKTGQTRSPHVMAQLYKNIHHFKGNIAEFVTYKNTPKSASMDCFGFFTKKKTQFNV